jgi:hypothetical protein
VAATLTSNIIDAAEETIGRVHALSFRRSTVQLYVQGSCCCLMVVDRAKLIAGLWAYSTIFETVRLGHLQGLRAVFSTLSPILLCEK